MPKKKTDKKSFAESFEPVPRLKMANIDTPTWQNWKSIFHAVSQCVVPSRTMLDEMEQSGKGMSFIYAQAMMIENRPLFDALTDVAIRNYDFQTSMKQKLIPSGVAFDALCDRHQYAMRGAVRNLIKSFKSALEVSGSNLSDDEKLYISDFVEKVDQLSQPVHASSKMQKRELVVA